MVSLCALALAVVITARRLLAAPSAADALGVNDARSVRLSSHSNPAHRRVAPAIRWEARARLERLRSITCFESTEDEIRRDSLRDMACLLRRNGTGRND